jgi:hypothetical protein
MNRMMCNHPTSQLYMPCCPLTPQDRENLSLTCVVHSAIGACRIENQQCSVSSIPSSPCPGQSKAVGAKVSQARRRKSSGV